MTCATALRAGWKGVADLALLPDIAATYRAPVRVQRAKIAAGSERLALAYLTIACALIFVGQWPVQARTAHLTGADLQQLLGASLMAWIFVAPLLFYGLALCIHWASRAVRRPVGSFAARMTLFWALLAAVPLWLLNGLTAAMMGDGPALLIVGLAAFGTFLVFWGAGLRAAREQVDLAPSTT